MKIITIGVFGTIFVLGVLAYYATAIIIFIAGMGDLKLKKWIRGALVILAIFIFYAGIAAAVYAHRHGIPKF